jgi:gamma-glutamylcyclotransferase
MPVKSEKDKVEQSFISVEKTGTILEKQKKDKIIKYFAYGSNLSNRQMKDRVGDWKSADKASLHKWKLIFNVKSKTWCGGAANIIRTGNPDDVVWGAIYQITLDQLDKLTKDYEKVSPKRKKVEVNGQKRVASTYIFSGKRPKLKPTAGYLETLIEGLKDHGYQEEIVQSVVSEANSI